MVLGRLGLAVGVWCSSHLLLLLMEQLLVEGICAPVLVWGGCRLWIDRLLLINNCSILCWCLSCAHTGMMIILLTSTVCHGRIALHHRLRHWDMVHCRSSSTLPKLLLSLILQLLGCRCGGLSADTVMCRSCVLLHLIVVLVQKLEDPLLVWARYSLCIVGNRSIFWFSSWLSHMMPRLLWLEMGKGV